MKQKIIFSVYFILLMFVIVLPTKHTPPPISSPTPSSTPLPTPSPTPLPPGVERVLIISYDGMRPDAIAEAPMPNLLRLMETGAYSLDNAITITYPSTLPSHAAMLSGLCMKENGIFFDRYFKYMGYSKGVDIFDLAHEAGMRTVMVVGKEKLRQLAEPETTDEFIFRPDESSIADAVIEQIPQGFGLMFVHFPSPDKIGHHYGWMGYSYLKMLRDGDDALGRIMDSLNQNGLLETTVIIITADHGGHDKNHIGLVIEDFRIPWIISGPTVISGKLSTDIQTMDTAATAALALGLELQEDWVGIPVYEAFGSPEGIKVHAKSDQWPCHINKIQ